MRVLQLFVLIGLVALCVRHSAPTPDPTPNPAVNPAVDPTPTLLPASAPDSEPACPPSMETDDACCDPHADPVDVLCDDCQQGIDPSERPADPRSAEDRQTMARISREGKRLIDQQAYTDMRVLIKQLQLERCSLELASPPQTQLQRSELYTQARESVVVVAGMYLCGKCDRWHASTASGFAISTNGAIVTNHHVVDSEKKKTLLVLTAQGHVLPVKRVLAASPRDDLAVLQVDSEYLTPLPIASDQAAAPVGSEVFVISHPANHFFSFTSGVVSRYFSYPSRHGNAACIDVTADYARGSSGAPVLNARGEVVGIVRSTESIYYAKKDGLATNLQMVFKHCIPADSLHAMIHAL